MTGEPGVGTWLRRVWTAASWEPSTWRGAVLEAVVTGIVGLALGTWMGVYEGYGRAFVLWWLPLWVAVRLVGFTYWRRRRRRAAARPARDAYHGRPAGG